MDLYIIRHAVAHPLGQKNEFTDEKRALTSEGRERMREGARGLRKLGVEFDLILTSPLVRAVETAEVVAAALGLDKSLVEQSSNLAPDGSTDALLAEIKRHAAAVSIAVIGHEPYLSELISKIVQGNGNLSLQLKKGGICSISISETVPSVHGSLAWLLTPKQLRLLAKP